MQSNLRQWWYAWVRTLTNRETKDVFRGWQCKAELSCVMADNLLKKKKKTRNRAVSVNASAAVFADKFHSASTQVCSVWAVTSLSIRRSAYLMLGSSKVMAGLFFWKSSLKMRLMMLSKPPRINCDKRSNVGEWLRPPTPSISYQLSEYPAGRCLD